MSKEHELNERELEKVSGGTYDYNFVNGLKINGAIFNDGTFGTTGEGQMIHAPHSVDGIINPLFGSTPTGEDPLV